MVNNLVNESKVKAHILGYPRMGEKRELKFALEAFWRKETTVDALQNTAKTCATTTGKSKKTQAWRLLPPMIFHCTTTC